MTKIASLGFAAALLLSGLSTAHATTYEILLPSPTQAGSVLLSPGQYRVTVEGTDAVFLDVRHSRSFRTVAKIEDNDVTYGATRISTRKVTGTVRMNAIELEGSCTRIEFP